MANDPSTKSPPAEAALPLHSNRDDLDKRPCSRSPRRHLFATALVAITLACVLWQRVSWSSPDTHLTTNSVCGTPSCARNPAYLIKAKNGAVASENEICSNIGVDVLKKGGNAVDAAIGATLCIGVVNMFSSGIGGGGFMTVRLPPNSTSDSSEVWTIDFRERAPLAAHENMYVADPNTARWGGLAVGVPGELRGLEKAHQLWGSMDWKELVMPAAELAKGWIVQKELERRLLMDLFTQVVLNHPDWKPIFAPHGCILREGDLIQRTALAKTLTTIAEEGPDAFYKGPIADAILAKINATGGVMTQHDLDQYEVKVERALQGKYRGRTIHTTHAPTSGPVLLHMFNLLEMYEDFVEEGRTPLNVHRVVEIMKFGFAARTRLSDPAFMGTKEVKTIHQIPTKLYAESIFPNITDDSTHTPQYYQPIYDVPTDHGTSHTSILDKNGMAVSITSTVNLLFGSLVLDPVTGVIFNDEMDDFSIPGVTNAFGLLPSPYNYPQPGKRPLSSTVPTIIEDAHGDFFAATGASGGSRIFPAVFQALMNLDWGLDASSAVEFGRLHDQLFPTYVDADNVYPEEMLTGLRERGHNVTLSDIGRVAAVVQLVTKRGDTIYAASDSRKRGKAAGY